MFSPSDAEDHAPSALALRSGRLVRLVLEHRQRLAWAVALFPLPFVVLLALGKGFAPGLYRSVTAEDSVVEYATFAAYLVAALIAMSLASDLRRQRRTPCSYAYGLLAVGMFLVAMEEVSWGQRIFGIDTPDYLEGLNRQGEMTFHNIGGFPLHTSFIVVGLFGAFARLLVPSSIRRRRPMLVDLFTPSYALSLYFLVPAALYAHYQYLFHRYLGPLNVEWGEFYRVYHPEAFVNGGDQEPIELLLSLGFLLFVLMNRSRYHRSGQEQGADDPVGHRRFLPPAALAFCDSAGLLIL